MPNENKVKEGVLSSPTHCNWVRPLITNYQKVYFQFPYFFFKRNFQYFKTKLKWLRILPPKLKLLNNVKKISRKNCNFEKILFWLWICSYFAVIGCHFNRIYLTCFNNFVDFALEMVSTCRRNSQGLVKEEIDWNLESILLAKD